MTRTVNLYGGPLHGKQMTIQSDVDHVHIKGLVPQKFDPFKEFDFNDVGVPTRTGTYSQVRGPGNQDNFEWDGWVTHE